MQTDREPEGVMLSVTGLNHFYYVCDFTDMRCKHGRVLSIIRERLHREPSDGDVFIVMSKFAKAANPGGDQRALVFHDDLSLFYKLEHEYDEEGIDAEERRKRRQSLGTKEIMIRLRSNPDIELAKDDSERSPYLTEALNYLCKFRDGIFAYRKDGHYPIDNNIAERTIRKLTTQRNNSLHYGSDEGVEMAVAYHSVISTVKLHGMSCWRYLGEFFQKIFNGCRDFLSLTLANINMAYANC